MNPLHRLREIYFLLLAQQAQLNRIEGNQDFMSQGLDELNAQIATLKASEQALLQREDARDKADADRAQAEKERADALQAALDDLRAHPAAPDLSGPIAAIAAIQADMDAAAPAAGGTPPA